MRLHLRVPDSVRSNSVWTIEAERLAVLDSSLREGKQKAPCRVGLDKGLRLHTGLGFRTLFGAGLWLSSRARAAPPGGRDFVAIQLD